MAAKKNARKKKTTERRPVPPAVRKAAGIITRLLVLGALIACGGWGITRLDGQVRQSIKGGTAPEFHFVDLPQELAQRARGDLEFAVRPFSDADWTSGTFCRQVARRLEEVAWIARVKHVRSLEAGRIEIACRYRTPFAMTRDGTYFYLVGADGVRLPGIYDYDPSWPHVYGVEGPAPEEGGVWPGKDLRAGLNIIALLAKEPFRHQISAVLMDNFQGRADPRSSHVELATDRQGGRILWGSAPGHEIEENSVGQKVAILRSNYARTGRVDAGNLAIDISTFPDRFSIPR